jgi:hypothetical protein
MAFHASPYLHTKDAIWRSLAEALGGRFTAETLHSHSRIDLRVDAWHVTLDVLAGRRSHFTRVRAPYVNPSGFRFRLTRSSVRSELAAFMGEDVRVGDPAFDAAFIVQGSEEARVRKLLVPALRAQLLAHPYESLEVKPDEGWFGARFPEGVDELSLAIPGIVVDEAALRDTFELFGTTLHRLCELGAATSERAKVRL